LRILASIIVTANYQSSIIYQVWTCCQESTSCDTFNPKVFLEHSELDSKNQNHFESCNITKLHTSEDVASGTLENSVEMVQYCTTKHAGASLRLASQYSVRGSNILCIQVMYTVVIRPSVHWVLPVTNTVHWKRCSFLGNHRKLPYMALRRMPDRKFRVLGRFWAKNIGRSRSPIPKVFSSRVAVTRHLDTRSDYYSTLEALHHHDDSQRFQTVSSASSDLLSSES